MIRNENDTIRKKETDDIINACYQNESDISECMKKLELEESNFQKENYDQYEDFQEYFDRVDVSNDDPKMNVKRISEFELSRARFEYTSFLLRVEEEDFYYIKIYSDRSRGLPNDSDLSLYVVKEEECDGTSESFDPKLSKLCNKNTFSLGVKHILKPGFYRIIPICWKDFFTESDCIDKHYNLVVHSKQQIFLSRINEDMDSTANKFCEKLINEYSRFDLRNDPYGLKFFGHRQIRTSDGQYAYILISDPTKDVFMLSCYNSSLKDQFRFELKVEPQTYDCVATLKSDRKKKITFQIVEKFTVYKPIFDFPYFAEKQDKLHLKFFAYPKNSIHEIKDRNLFKVALVHRYVENPEVLFQKYCMKSSKNANDYEVSSLRKRNFQINLVSYVFERYKK